MRNGAVRFTVSVRVKSSGVVSATSLMKKIPALLTTMSGTPRSARTRVMARSTADASARSHDTSVRRSAVPACRLRATRTTWAPAPCSASATASPIPRDAPVTIASFPASAPSLKLLLQAPAAVHQSEKLVPGLRVLEQRTPQRAGDGLRVLLLHAAHHHAEVI